MNRRKFLEQFALAPAFCFATRALAGAQRLTGLTRNRRLIRDLVFNRRCADRQPAAIYTDVGAALREHLRSNRPLRALGGGHGYLGHAVVDGGILVDLRASRQVRVDPQQQLLQVQAGARFSDIYRALATASGDLPLVLTTGDCPTVGVAGYILGGGYGHLSRWFGPACDSVVTMNAVVIDRQDQILQKSLNRDSQGDDGELFWALRGSGGAKIGVVTDFTLKLFKQPSGLRIYELRLRPDLTQPDLVKAIHSWQVWIGAAFASGSTSSKWALGRGWSHISGLSTSPSDIADLCVRMQPFMLPDGCRLDVPFTVTNIAAAFKQCTSLEACEQQPRQAFAARSAFLTLERLGQVAADIARCIDDRGRDYQTYGGLELMAWRLPDGFNPDNAFRQRQHDLLCQFYTEGYADERESWMQRLFTAVTGQAANDAVVPGYLNYLDATVRDGETGFPEAYFADANSDLASRMSTVARLTRLVDGYRKIHV